MTIPTEHESKRPRPPNISIASGKSHRPAVVIETQTPVDSEDDEDGGILKLDSAISSPIMPILPLDINDIPDGDDIVKDLQALAQLRKNVQQNLRLRPIRSSNSLPKVSLVPDRPFESSFVPSPSMWKHEFDPQPLDSPTSSTSSYFTPMTDAPTTDFIGSSASDSSSLPRTPSPPQTRSVDPGILYERLLAPRKPLLIDTRPHAAHAAFRIRHSINIAIPSLILKRCLRPGGAFQSLAGLRQFITTDEEKTAWDKLLKLNGPWDGDVIVYDEDMNVKDRGDMTVTPWALLSLIAPVLSYGCADYLIGGISSAGHHPELQTLIDVGLEPESQLDDDNTKKGLFHIKTQGGRGLKIELDQSSAAQKSPLPIMPSAMFSSSDYRTADSSINIIDASPSPPPSQTGFRRPPPPLRRPSAPNLRRLDTKSIDRLPKLSLRTMPTKSATLAVPPLSATAMRPLSPSHLNHLHSHQSPIFSPYSAVSSDGNFFTPYSTPPHTPITPMPTTPKTARQELEVQATEESFPSFTISTILPNFLFLGPELTTPEQVTELKQLGVRRILNIAAECDDDHGLRLRVVFEKYFKIPMRDTVEEENIAQGVREVCDILDDARLHSAPTYVHCKAGKSRSVTAVMAYLIHANHWTLSRAYSFVLERRKGISPNIGFVSELMTFEEQELGGKSVGVQPSAPASTSEHSDGHHDSHYAGVSSRRGGHIRESLPPALGGGEGFGGLLSSPLSTGGKEMRMVSDSSQEVEIKDADGRYRHARRAPVDETTLQPLRRVSKAGLESSAYS